MTSAPSLNVRVGGHRVAYVRAGVGPAVVLLHGGGGDHREWRRQLAGLSDRFDLVAWDAPGCGGSSDPPESFQLADYADVLAGFVGALGLGRPHIVGLSWGGGLAIELAQRHPGVPASLTLASAYAGWAGSLPPEIVDERLRACLQEASLPPETWVRDWIPGLLTESAPESMAEELVEIMLDVRPAGYRAMARSFAAADLREALPGIAVPTLLLYGALDRRCPPHVGEGIAGSIRGARLVVLPGVGHMCNVEADEAFTAELRRFLDGVPREP